MQTRNKLTTSFHLTNKRKIARQNTAEVTWPCGDEWKNEPLFYNTGRSRDWWADRQQLQLATGEQEGRHQENGCLTPTLTPTQRETYNTITKTRVKPVDGKYNLLNEGSKKKCSDLQKPNMFLRDRWVLCAKKKKKLPLSSVFAF